MIKPGDQIVYIPNHSTSMALKVSIGEHEVIEDVSQMMRSYPNHEFGFVTSVSATEVYIWCRFWNRDRSDLRTKSCSEGVWSEHITKVARVPSVTQAAIDAVCEKYGIEIRRDDD